MGQHRHCDLYNGDDDHESGKETSSYIVASKHANDFAIAIQLDEQPFFHILV